MEPRQKGYAKPVTPRPFTEARDKTLSEYMAEAGEPQRTLDTLAFAGQRNQDPLILPAGVTKLTPDFPTTEWKPSVQVANTTGQYIVPAWSVAPVPNSRPTWAATFLEVARIFSLRGTCPRRQVGCVITSADNHVLATGYNGAPTGLPHCSEAGCTLDGDGRCIRAVHAEMNAILQAAYLGISIKGGKVFCTDRPCVNCAKAIIQVGLTQVIFARDDLESPARSTVLALFRRAGVEVGVYKADEM